MLDNLVRLKRGGVWIEVTTLVIPGLNDGDDELRAIAHFVRDELGAETPWHVSRFHPTYRLTDRPPTPVETVLRAREIGLAAGLPYVYVGNVAWVDGENTCCSGLPSPGDPSAGFSVAPTRRPEASAATVARLAGVFD